MQSSVGGTVVEPFSVCGCIVQNLCTGRWWTWLTKHFWLTQTTRPPSALCLHHGLHRMLSSAFSSQFYASSTDARLGEPVTATLPISAFPLLNPSWEAGGCQCKDRFLEIWVGLVSFFKIPVKLHWWKVTGRVITRETTEAEDKMYVVTKVLRL